MFNLDLTNVKTNDFGPIPEGMYRLICDDAQIKETKDGTGEYVNVKFKVLGGDHDGRFIFSMFNIKNKNEKAVEIGIGQLKSFMKCAGCTDFVLKSPLDLVGLRCDATVKIKSDSYGDKNVVSYFKKPATTEAAAVEQAPRAASPF